MKKKILPLIGLAISAFFLYLALRNVEFHKISETLKLTDYRWVIAAMFIYASSFFFRGIRWKFIMQSIKSDCRVIDMFRCVTIAFFANNILPARIGELVGAYVNAKKHDITKTSSFATVVVSRVFDGISLILFAVILAVYLWLSGNLGPTALNYLRKTGPFIVALFF